MPRTTLAAVVCLILVGSAQAQTVPIGINGVGTYFEDFNGMGTVVSTYPIGWNGYKITGAGALADGAFINSGTTPAFLATDGSDNTDTVHNFGTSGSADRALGSIGGPQTVPGFGMVLVNNSGQTIEGHNITMTFRAEQWRTGSANNADETWVFEYKTGGGSQDINETSSAGWTQLATFNINEILTTSSGGNPVDGNAAGNFVTITGTLTGLVWNAGDRLALRWLDANDQGNDAGMSIDDFSFVVGVPEPSTYLLCGSVLAGFALLRRRQGRNRAA